MSATTTIGLRTFLTKAAAVPDQLVPTAISAAKPAVVTVVGATAVPGDLAFVKNTGFRELDNRWFVVGTATATSIELIGSDTTGTAGVLGAAPEMEIYARADMVEMCLSTVDPAVPAAGTTSVGTFCDPSATVPAVAQAGTLTLTGFVELQAYYDELNMAANDGIARTLMVELPQSLGHIVVPATLSSIGWQLPIDGGIGFTVSGAMATKPRHLY
jgi:hypothetical protein